MKRPGICLNIIIKQTQVRNIYRCRQIYNNN